MTIDHTLPSISPLPPIEMPDTPTSLSPCNTPDQEHSSFIRCSSASRASQNSFSTAMSTTPAPGSPPESQTHPASPIGPLSLAPPQPLRKSLSVGSFVRRDPLANGTRTKRTNTDLAMQVPVLLPLGSRDYEHRAFQQITRHRGVSFSTQGDYDPSIFEDSDFDAWHCSNRRRSSLKGKDQHHPLVPPGQLKLPPRMPALSIASSISSISTAPGSPMEEYRRLHSTTSMQHIPTRLTHPGVASISGRARSGSLGVKVTGSGKPMFVNTSPPPKPLAESSNPMTIAVVGAIGSGKSTVIRKGAKPFGLSDFSVLSAPPGMLGVPTPLRYVRRIGMITDIAVLGERTPSCPLHILEIDVAHLAWGQSPSFSADDSSMGSQVDGVLICYDASTPSSFTHVEDLLKRLCILKTPFMVLACKTDLEKRVDPKQALDLLKKYDSGLVEATVVSKIGKDKMRRSFEWLIKAIVRDRARDALEPDYVNPASPQALAALAPWENPAKTRSSTDSSVVVTPTASSSTNSLSTVADSHAQASASRLQPPATVPMAPSPRSPSVPTSPTRARSMSDLLSEHEKSKSQGRSLDRSQGSLSIMTLGVTGSISSDQLQPTSAEALSGAEDTLAQLKRPPRPTQWATLDELLHKLMFLGVSGDDVTFINNFFLTYRRFASPRSVLLAMQKRMRLLDGPNNDPMFTCFAQMKICNLLDIWIRDYPSDFAVRGTAGALHALVRAILTKTYLLHYGCDFLPFTEMLPNFKDKDAEWALPVQNQTFDDDDIAEDDDDDSVRYADSSLTTSSTEGSILNQPPPSITGSSRERKSSLPLSATLPTNHESTEPDGFSPDDPDSKKLLKDLVKVAQEVSSFDVLHVAEEITRIEAQYFLDIEPRHWLHYTLVGTKKKDSQSDTITKFNLFSNNLAGWVASLILCHDRPKHRAKQIEKFVEIAVKLRALNNYSALRAFVAGINISTFATDPTMDILKARTPDLFKTFQSWDILFQAIRSHRAYRMALRSSKGACIPALEVHMSDLIRAHEGNQESNPDHPGKIHWGKYNMIGKFVSSTTQCQTRCRTSSEYNFIPREAILRLITEQRTMDFEMQRSRIAAPPEEAFEEIHRGGYIPRATSREPPASNLVRKLFSW